MPGKTPTSSSSTSLRQLRWKLVLPRRAEKAPRSGGAASSGGDLSADLGLGSVTEDPAYAKKSTTKGTGMMSRAERRAAAKAKAKASVKTEVKGKGDSKGNSEQKAEAWTARQITQASFSNGQCHNWQKGQCKVFDCQFLHTCAICVASDCAAYKHAE